MKTVTLLFLLAGITFSTTAKDPSAKCNKGKTEYSCSSIKKAKRDFFCSSRKYTKKNIERVCKRTPKKVTKKKT